MASSGSSGSVPINDIIKAEFTNIYEKEPLPEDTVKLNVENKLAGEVKESDKDDGAGKTKTAKTGDSSNLILWFVLMMISVIGMGVVFAGRKRS